MATFTKLLTIKIVASNSFGLFKSRIDASALGSFDSRISSLSSGESEKKATSEPETKAEATNNSMRTIIAIQKFTPKSGADIAKKIKLKGSVSSIKLML